MKLTLKIRIFHKKSLLLMGHHKAAIYTPLLTNKEIKAMLLTSKTCDTPAKPLTIPQLEFLSCLLLSKLIKNIYESIKHEITIA